MAKTKPARRGAAKAARKTGRAKSARPAAKGAKAASGARRAAGAKAAGRAKAAGAAKGGAKRKASGSAKTARAGARTRGAKKAKTATTARTTRPAAASGKMSRAGGAATGNASKARTSARPAKIRTRTVTGSTSRRAPTLDRDRRRVREADIVPSPPSSLDMDRSASAARSGRAEMRDRLHEHTSSGPELTGGDVDADWEGAEATGDEAPGGDNMTPDQDVVEEIGKALGVEYDDDEELRGGDEIVERDKKRWELDPASKDDFDERDD